MYRFLVKSGILAVVFFLINTTAQAQCAMCRATLENNFSNGEIGPGANINIGIIYLFVFPYILIALVAFFWYRNSRASRASQV